MRTSNPDPTRVSSFDDAKGLKVKVHREDLWGTSGLPAIETSDFRFKPKAFVVENSKLEGKVIEASVQISSFKTFEANPKAAMTYISAGNPDDVKARHFAMFLASLHCKWIRAQGKAPTVLWERLYGGFDNPAMRPSQDPTLIVIDNLSVIPNKVKYDKARDLITRWSSIPRILVVAGEDPISFAASRIYKPCHGLAYFPSKLTKIATQII